MTNAWNDVDTTMLKEKEVIKLMNAKGYQTSTFQEFERDHKHMVNDSVRQVATCKHNLDVMKSPRNIGKFYTVKMSNGLQVRTWEVR